MDSIWAPVVELPSDFLHNMYLDVVVPVRDHSMFVFDWMLIGTLADHEKGSRIEGFDLGSTCTIYLKLSLFLITKDGLPPGISRMLDESRIEPWDTHQSVEGSGYGVDAGPLKLRSFIGE